MTWEGSQDQTLTIKVRFVQYLRLDDLFDDILQGDDAHHLVEGVPFALIIHPLDNGQVRFP